MLVLGIESSCDDSAAAVLRDGVLAASVVSSQHEVHGPYGGVVPELASREHIRHIIAVIDAALGQAGVELDAIDGIAVTRGPGLIGSLLVGLSAAKGIALRRGLPLVGVHHLEGHLLAVNLERPPLDPLPYPFLGLIVSGGHSGLYLAVSPGAYRCLGRTRDDAVGEAFDKVAKVLGLGYPGGPAIDRLARTGNPKAIRFPRARLKSGRFDLSFSGFKTAVWQWVRDHRPGEAELPDVAASVQEALSCHAVYIAASEEPRLAGLLAALAGRAVLTLSDIDRFADKGGMIGLSFCGPTRYGPCGGGPSPSACGGCGGCGGCGAAP